MKKNILTLLMVCAAMIGFVVAGCSSPGSSDSSAASHASKATVSGVASLDMMDNGTVSMIDSSVPAQEKTAAVNSNGNYTVDVSGLKPPFLLKAEGADQAGNGQTLYSVSKNGGRANINPISDTAVAASADNTGPSVLSIIRSSESEDEHHRTADHFEVIISRLRTVLAPLFELYQISGNAVTDDDDENDNSGLRAMFQDVRFVVKDRRVTVTNRQTGDVIFSGSLRDLASGTFYAENMPAGPGGSTACAYTYDAWSACQSDGTQTRNMLTSSPAGCTGTPVLSQPCTYSANSSGLQLHLWCMGRMSVKRNAGQGPCIVIARRLHWHAGPDTELHTAAGGLHRLQLLRVGHMHEQPADQNCDITVPRQLRRDARSSVDPVTGLHLAASLYHLQLLRVGHMHEQPADQNCDITVPRQLRRDARSSVDPVTGLHLAGSLHHLQLLRVGHMHEQPADQNCDITVPRQLRRDARSSVDPVTGLHLAGGLYHLQLLRVGHMHEQPADQNGDITVPRQLRRDARNSVDPVTGLHLAGRPAPPTTTPHGAHARTTCRPER